MVELKDLFKLKSHLENNNPYMTEDIFYSKERDIFILDPFDEGW